MTPSPIVELPTIVNLAPPPGVRTGPNYTFTETPAYGGIDGEEFMGTGTAFDTSEAEPTYTEP